MVRRDPLYQHRIRRLDIRWAIGLFAMVVAAGCLRIAPGVCGVYHDDAIYVDTAHALAQGQGYRLPHVPDAPAQTKYPIAYPVLLSAIWRIWPRWPDNLLAMQGLSLVCGAAYITAGYLYLVRCGYFSRHVALAGAILTGTSSSALYFASTTMAEMPFALSLVAALWMVDRWLGSECRSRGRAASVGAVVALPFLFRTIGAPLVPAACWLAWRSGRRPLWLGLGSAVVASPWVAWSFLGLGDYQSCQVAGYYTDYLGSWSSTGFSLFARVLQINAFAAAHGAANLSTEGAWGLGGTAIYRGPAAVLVALLGLVAWGSIVMEAKQIRALPVYLSAYLGLILVWSWPPHRFLIPIQLYLACYLARGVATAARGFWPFRTDVSWAEKGPGCLTCANPIRWGWAMTALLVAGNLHQLAWHASRTHATGYPLMRQDQDQVEWSSFTDLFTWIGRHTRPDDVLASGLDSMIALYTDRTAVRAFAYRPGALFYGDGKRGLLTPDELASILDQYQVRFLIQVPLSGFAENEPFAHAIAELVKQEPSRIKEVYRGSDERFLVYAITIEANRSGRLPGESGIRL